MTKQTKEKKKYKSPQQRYEEAKEEYVRKKAINRIFSGMFGNMTNNERYRTVMGRMKKEVKAFEKGLEKII